MWGEGRGGRDLNEFEHMTRFYYRCFRKQRKDTYLNQNLVFLEIQSAEQLAFLNGIAA